MHTHPESHYTDEEYTLPSVEALLAGTLALMTGYAQSARECPHRPMMAHKLATNLSDLSAHPQLSLPMRSMLAKLRTRWEAAGADAGTAAPAQPAPLWHRVPASLQ